MNSRLSLGDLIKIVGIILTSEGTILTYFKLITDPITFVVILVLTALIVTIIALLFDKIKEQRRIKKETEGKKKETESKRDKIMVYLKSLKNDIEKTRKIKSDFFIDKLSKNITVRGWLGQIRGYEKEPKQLLQILENKESPVAIIGGGGTGKTFTLWKWCIDACEKLEITPNNGKIPVYIPLADLGKYEPIALKDYIQMIKKGGNAIDPFFDELESDGRLFFIFDGFNEIGLSFRGTREESRNYFENTMTELCEYWKKLQGNGCVVVVSSRDTTPYLEEEIRSFFRRHNFNVYEIDPLSNSNVKEISEDHLKRDSQRFIATLEDIGGYDLVRDAWHLYLFIEELSNIYEKKLPATLQQIYERDILRTIERNLIATGVSGKRELYAIKEILEEIAYDIIKEKQSGQSFSTSVIEKKRTLHPDVPFEHVTGCGFFENVDGDFRFSQNRNEVLAALKIKQSANLKKEIEDRIKEERWHNTLVYLSKIIEESDYLIDVALNNEHFILAANIIKNASIVKNKDIISTFLFNLTMKLNDVRLLTCKERLADPRYDKILHTFFKVVDILGNIALTPFLNMCTNNDFDPLIRAQGIYFIEESENLIIEKEHIVLLSKHLNEEKNIHVIFHMLVVLEKFLMSDEFKEKISKQIKETLHLWDDFIQLQAILILHRNNLLPYTKEHFIQRFEKHKQKILELIADLRKFEKIPRSERTGNFNEILERLEPSLWLTAELAKEKIIDLDDALKLLSQALNEESSPFWIVQWWAIFNLGKIETDGTKQLLLENITNPLIDLGLLCIKSLAASKGGEVYIRSFVENANEKLPTLSEESEIKDLNIRMKEAKDAIEMLSQSQK